MNIILIGNYKPDNQFSMRIFAELIEEGYKKSGENVFVMRPDIFFSKINYTKLNTNKWLGYLDKFALFPIKLLVVRGKNFLLRNPVHYHICDHSNAFYLHFLPKNKTIISCHDVLAIQSGLGFTDTYCSTTKSGVVLQKIILDALSGAKKLAAVSDFTLNQLIAIDVKPNIIKNWKVIHNTFSKKFSPSNEENIHKLTNKFGQLKGKKIILHVGSSLERKNRKLLVKTLYELQNDWDGVVVFAGDSLSVEVLELIENLKVTDKIIQIYRPDNEDIVALYSICQAMIFPSYSEGFGWPIIEAQACGAPVITSNKAPMMTEVGGNAALYADPDDPNSFANQFRKLNNEAFRADVIRLGFENAKRFNFENTIKQYIELIQK